jgi:hypothetical protein
VKDRRSDLKLGFGCPDRLGLKHLRETTLYQDVHRFVLATSNTLLDDPPFQHGRTYDHEGRGK